MVISGSGLALYPIETALKSIYKFKQGNAIQSGAEFLDFVKKSQECCVSKLRLVIFDGDMPDIQTIIVQAKEILNSAKVDRCAFVALVEQSKLLANEKPLAKSVILEIAEKKGFSLLM